MKISLNWLKDFVDVSSEEANQLALKFTMASAEVEGVEDLAKDFNNVVTAKILEINPHPDAEKLQVTKVDNGKEVLQVVCGAKNIEIGQIVPLAMVGAVLPGDFKIKVSNKRGVESFGMLCSGQELGVPSDVDGILILSENTPIGLKVSDVLGKNDCLIELDNKSITHRPDLWGHYGIGRELASILKKNFKKLDFTLPEYQEEKVKIEIEIKEPELCQRYCAMAFEGIEIKESPEWLKQRLINIGAKPINNVVDATNYLMFELGQPVHSFDGEKLASNKIIIRKAYENEKLFTLDSIERQLTPEMLVIADENKAIALAGVMGGENTEVDTNTKYVILESANFHPANVRRTALKLALRTEASARFEKTLDPEMTTQAIARFYTIMKETCPNIKAVSKLADVDYSSKDPVFVTVSKDFINKRLGTDLSSEFIEETLSALGFEISKKDNEYTLKVPTYRATKDIAIPEDIVEEIGRIYGYDNITPVAPKIEVKPVQENPLHILRKDLRNIFSLDLGFKEVYNYSFNGSLQLKKLGLDFDNHIKLRNPLSQEQEYLRISLIPNMLEAVNKNIRNFEEFDIYELGKAYYKEFEEKEFLCAMNVMRKPSSEMFYTSKACLEEVMQKLGITDYELKLPNEADPLPSFYHPSRTAMITQRKLNIGIISEIHPKILKEFDISGKVGFIYLDMKALLEVVKRKIKFKELPKYPHVPFDISVFVDKKVLVADVEKTIEKVNKNLIKDINLFDIYQGSNLPENKKSLAFTINFYSNERTLEPQEIKDLQNGVMKALNDKGYEVRG
ncbi:MAG: phenylalanine--tRNA ligase subunit beta [Candidatus Sericytochromatia bacterium]